jgi:hypothetical protein
LIGPSHGLTVVHLNITEVCKSKAGQLKRAKRHYASLYNLK